MLDFMKLEDRERQPCQISLCPHKEFAPTAPSLGVQKNYKLVNVWEDDKGLKEIIFQDFQRKGKN